MTAPSAAEALHQEIRDIYLGNARRPYGLYGINQLQHALQSAAHAEAQALSSSMVMACLLHDVGHMIHDLGEAPAEDGVDDLHEALGAAWAAERFPLAVSEPIRLHVAAKRYLCSVEPGYQDGLSKDSRISLALQGGVMGNAEQIDFLNERFADQAIALRRIDELAKDKNAVTDELEVFLRRHLAAALVADVSPA
ncbi:metal-dependent phosphohydrolase [uncultured Caulobacter sp.]|jgi:[1-hydroxy-2-(trimethylamino)ethyl]phosphonate dioxygenase|uniref:metal-dependent phosphohydrolase n=1 Tax=uncultured Caulobacter sp. TaxID=158749 RepID=UPI0026149275|nr:metal-dependent phosphohydrolase [uncultured Caulobacter sp.]